MHIHRRQKHADLLPVAWWRRLGDCRSRHENPAVGGRQHDIAGTRAAWTAGADSSVPFGIAKEEEKEPGEDDKRYRQRPRDDRGRRDRQGQGADDERKPGGIDARADQLRASACEGTDGGASRRRRRMSSMRSFN